MNQILDILTSDTNHLHLFEQYIKINKDHIPLSNVEHILEL